MRFDLPHILILPLLTLVLTVPPALAATQYTHLPIEIEDRLAGGKEMDAWAKAYKSGNMKVADASWRKISAQVKPFDGLGPLLKVAHMRFAFADDEKPYDGVALDQHLLKNTEATLGMNHPAVADCLSYLCMGLQSNHKSVEAEAAARRMVEIYKKTIPESDERRSTSLAKLAQVLRQQNREEEARKIGSESVRLWRKYPHQRAGMQWVFPESRK